MNWNLVFATRQDADAALSCLPNYKDKNGNVQVNVKGHGSGKGWHVYHIGAITEKVEVDENGIKTVVKAADNRHHVNVMASLEIDEILKNNVADSVVYPSTPDVVWSAGQNVTLNYVLGIPNDDIL